MKNIATHFVPRAVDVKPQGLQITWSNQQSRHYSAQLLRQACPCAQCISEISGEVMLNRVAVPHHLTLTSAEPVGNYGVTFGFSDHHATGIYAYDYLYGLPESFIESNLDSHSHDDSQNQTDAHNCGCGHNGCHS